MGFVDYKGDKEDRYTDVLEFARAQQEEEQRRLESIHVNSWVAEMLRSEQYLDISISELLKHIIVRYRKLYSINGKMHELVTIHRSLDLQQLWADFSLWIITRQMTLFDIPHESRVQYVQTYCDKVFKVNARTSSEDHLEYLQSNESYLNYFSKCFDLEKEKYFWKWLRWSGDGGTKQLELFNQFKSTYVQLSVLLGLYFYQTISPDTNAWMECIERDVEALDALSAGIHTDRFKPTDLAYLGNPLYKAEVPVFKADYNIKRCTPIKKKLADLDDLLETRTIRAYIDACKLLVTCELPEKMASLYNELIDRLEVLDETALKFQDVYQADMYQFHEYYIPEAVRLTATHLEYIDTKVGDAVISQTEEKVLSACNTLLLAVNEKIEEIFKFASMEIKAKAMALDAIMNQDGYVDPAHKIN